MGKKAGKRSVVFPYFLTVGDNQAEGTKLQVENVGSGGVFLSTENNTECSTGGKKVIEGE